MYINCVVSGAQEFTVRWYPLWVRKHCSTLGSPMLLSPPSAWLRPNASPILQRHIIGHWNSWLFFFKACLCNFHFEEKSLLLAPCHTQRSLNHFPNGRKESSLFIIPAFPQCILSHQSLSDVCPHLFLYTAPIRLRGCLCWVTPGDIPIPFPCFAFCSTWSRLPFYPLSSVPGVCWAQNLTWESFGVMNLLQIKPRKHGSSVQKEKCSLKVFCGPQSRNLNDNLFASWNTFIYHNISLQVCGPISLVLPLQHLCTWKL